MNRAGLLVIVLATSVLAAVAPASANSSVSVLSGSTLRTMPVPNDALTVADPRQLTGKRLNLRAGTDYPACDAAHASQCDVYTQLNRLDGFDIQPRVTIPFSGPIDISSVNDTDLFIQGPDGRTGIVQLVWDPASNTLAGLSNAELHEASTYDLVVTSFIHDTAGRPVNACGGACVVPFTTMTATAELDHIRHALDDGSAFAAAGIGSTASRKLGFTQHGTPDVFTAALIQPSVVAPTTGMLRLDQTTTDPNHLESSTIPDLTNRAAVNVYAFGSFLSPRYQYSSAPYSHDDPNGFTDGEIPMIPSTQTPQPFGADRIGAVLIVPQGTPPAGGWPVAIYGPGFTRSKLDIFVSADENAALGIATIATDPAGHAFGPNSQVTVTQGPTSTTFLSYGRGRNLNGDGLICDGLKDGVGPTEHITAVNPDASKANCNDRYAHDAAGTPSHKPIDGLRSGLIQTVVDNMALARSIAAGVDVPGVGNDILSHTAITYYGISFGGIYGTMLMGTDPVFQRGVLNVPGGPIVDIARLSGFRGDLANTLRFGQPDIRNGGPGLNGFTESIPLRGDPPVTNPYPGAIQIQELFAATNWYDRSGSPETFAPLIRDRPLAGVGKRDVIFQTALGDHTVPNPTAGDIYRAGNLFDLVTYYRNDHSDFPNGGWQTDPHGWLADPTIDARARSAGQLQVGQFLMSGQRVDPNTYAPPYPERAGPLFETPIANPANTSCLHYNDPQTGKPYNPAPDQPDCPTLAIDQHTWLDVLALAGVVQQGQANLAGGGGGLPLTSTGGPAPWPFLLLVLGAAALAPRIRRRA